MKIRPLLFAVTMGNIVLLDMLLRFAFGVYESQIKKSFTPKFWLHSFDYQEDHVIGD